jgi:hypothetical protein
LGNFSYLQELPLLYDHCQETEDKDMNALDFITDHLLNIDGLFDNHDQGDEQKPHLPPAGQHHSQTAFYFVNLPDHLITPFYIMESDATFIPENDSPTSFAAEIFRPPMFA